MENRWLLDKPGFNKDLLIYKNELRNAVPKDALCIVGNDGSHFIMFYYIDKKGWCFHNSQPDMKKMILEGAEYLYLDTTTIENTNTILPFCDKMIIKKGSIQVYQLKKQIP
jgi:hypothetical protein